MAVLPKFLIVKVAESAAERVTDEFYDNLPYDVQVEDGGKIADEMVDRVWDDVYNAVADGLESVYIPWEM